MGKLLRRRTGWAVQTVASRPGPERHTRACTERVSTSGICEFPVASRLQRVASQLNILVIRTGMLCLLEATGALPSEMQSMGAISFQRHDGESVREGPPAYVER